MNFQTLIKPEFHHLLKKDDDVWKLLEPDFEIRLNEFLTTYSKIHELENKVAIAPEAFAMLPSQQKGFDWKLRRESLKEMFEILDNKTSQSILEVGSSNGWLSNRLAEAGQDVVAVDYFLNAPIGLKSKKYYTNHWFPLQCDLSNLTFFNIKFDFVILNHCVHFFENPFETIEQCKKLLRPNGKLIILGLSFFRRNFNKAEKVENFKKYYLDKYNFNIFLNPTKAFFDFDDMEKMEKEKIEIVQYVKFFWRNLIPFFKKSSPMYCYGVYENQ